MSSLRNDLCAPRYPEGKVLCFGLWLPKPAKCSFFLLLGLYVPNFIITVAIQIQELYLARVDLFGYCIS